VNGIKNQPVNSVKWVDRNLLKPNAYNPNMVAPPELSLLKLSLLEDGWTQAIVALRDMSIVDGFHRWTLSGTQDVGVMTGFKVPVVFIEADANHRMMSTIRHNRARGTHGVLKMADIVRLMVDDGLDGKQIMARLGMEKEELERLLDRSGMPSRATKEVAGFGRAWVPTAKGN
jgi:ParB-like chromosome segregation protein Spo0J